MKCMALGTLDIHSSQIMNRPVRIKRAACWW
jgi:hypothetical protein